MMALAAWLSGLWRVCRSAWLVVVVYVLLLAATVPLAVKLHHDLPIPAQPFAVEPGAGSIPDFEWLDEATANKRSLLGALVPTVIGVAAPLENLDALLEARPAMFTLLISAVMLVVWAWLWGGIIARFGSSSRRFFTACQQAFSNVLAISIAAVFSALVVYAVTRMTLFGVLLLITGESTSERVLLTLRLLATLASVGAVTAVTLVFDYARIAVVLQDISLRTALRRGFDIVRRHPVSVLVLVIASALMFASVLAAYAAFEFVPGGSVPTVKRIIVLGQAYIVSRIVLRLWNAAAQVALFERLSSRATSS